MLALNNSRVVVYGKRLTCPLYSSIPSEARKVIAGYRRAILLKFRSCQECGEQRAISSFFKVTLSLLIQGITSWFLIVSVISTTDGIDAPVS